MYKVFRPVLLLLLFSLQILTTGAQECEVTNTAFRQGEEVTYQIVYKWGLIWLEAGEVTFSVKPGMALGKETHHFTGAGGSYPKYDWIYKVRDVYEAYSDTVTLMPVKFRREVNEGGRYFIEEDLFVKNKAYVLRNDPKQPLMRDTVDLPPCTFDPLSAVYYARCLDFDNFRPGDKIPLNMFIDRDFTPVYIRYMGREEFTMPDGSVYKTIRFKPLLIQGTIFRGGEHMDVWVTDDANRLPIYIESDILIGSVKAIMISGKNLRNVQTAKLR